MKNSTAKEGVEYAWVDDYRRVVWDHRCKVLSTLNDKADAIFRYLGGGTGLFALGVLVKLDHEHARLTEVSLPALLCALAAILLACIAKNPSYAPNLPSIQDALTTYAEGSGSDHEAIGAFLGQWNLACEDMRLVCMRKANLIQWATWLYFVAISFLLLPITISIWH